MNGHDLLEAAGGISPEFVNASEKKRTRMRPVYQWGVVAACLCLITAAVILISRIEGRGQSQDNAEDVPGSVSGHPGYASAEGLAEGEEAEIVAENEDAMEKTENEGGEGMAENEVVEEVAVSDGDHPAMLMVNGVIYKYSYVPYEGQIDEALVQKVSGYADSGMPQQDGEQNFDRSSITTYIIIDDSSIAVRMGLEEGWVIFNAISDDSGDADVPMDHLDPAYGVGDQDAPADENGYAEAREYAPELLDLQERISAAMGPRRELSFVTSSMILEDPDRLVVTVNTEDEDLIQLLESYNTENVRLEIEYSADYGSEE